MGRVQRGYMRMHWGLACNSSTILPTSRLSPLLGFLWEGIHDVSL